MRVQDGQILTTGTQLLEGCDQQLRRLEDIDGRQWSLEHGEELDDLIGKIDRWVKVGNWPGSELANLQGLQSRAYALYNRYYCGSLCTNLICILTGFALSALGILYLS